MKFGDWIQTFIGVVNYYDLILKKIISITTLSQFKYTSRASQIVYMLFKYFNLLIVMICWIFFKM